MMLAHPFGFLLDSRIHTYHGSCWWMDEDMCLLVVVLHTFILYTAFTCQLKSVLSKWLRFVTVIGAAPLVGRT